MLSIEEIDQLRSLLEKQNRSQQTERLRDEKGRFTAENPSELQTPEELASRYKERCIKVVRVKGSYGKYIVKDIWLCETDKEILIVIVLFAVLAVIF